MRKQYILSLAVLLTMTSTLCASAKEEKVNSLEIDLIQPQKSNKPQRVLDVSTEPVVVSGRISVTIPIKPNLKDVEEDRYLVEYFIDDTLVYSTNGIVEGMGKPTFDWVLDTTKYKNGKHKLIVNYWDSKEPACIGVKYFIIQNPISVDELLNE